jgi:hypothetical protein
VFSVYVIPSLVSLIVSEPLSELYLKISHLFDIIGKHDLLLWRKKINFSCRKADKLRGRREQFRKLVEEPVEILRGIIYPSDSRIPTGRYDVFKYVKTSHPPPHTQTYIGVLCHRPEGCVFDS